MSDNGNFIIDIGAKVDTASFKAAADAARNVGAAFEKTAAQVGHSDGFDKATADIREQTKALKENEEQAKRTGSAQGELGAGDAAGKLGGGLGSVGRLSGLAGAFGAGEGFGLVGDVGDAVEGLSDLGGTLAELGPAGAVAGVAVVALGLVISDFAKGAQETADQINEAINTTRSVADELASGATSEDVQQSIEQLQFRRDLEKDILAESTQSYQEFVQGIKDAFGVFAPLVEGILKVIDPREEALSSQIETSNKLISESEAKERAYNEALEKGLTSKADAKKAAEDTAKADEKAAREAEAAEKKAQSEREKAAREAEQQAQRIQSAQDAITKSNENFANRQADQARQAREKLDDIAQSARDRSTDTDLKYYRDTVKIADEARKEERKAQLADANDEIKAARDTKRALEDIREEAIQSEEEAANSRNFLQASKIREGLEKANKQALKEAERGAEDRAEANKQEAQERADALQEARQERLDALKQERIDNDTARKREERNAETARKRQANETQIAYNREIEEKRAQLDKLLGLDQAYYAQRTNMAQAAANGGSTQTGISGGTSATGISISGAGQFSGSFGGLRPITTNNNRAVTINIAAGATDRELTAATVRVLGEVGLT